MSRNYKCKRRYITADDVIHEYEYVDRRPYPPRVFCKFTEDEMNAVRADIDQQLALDSRITLKSMFEKIKDRHPKLKRWRCDDIVRERRAKIDSALLAQLSSLKSSTVPAPVQTFGDNQIVADEDSISSSDTVIDQAIPDNQDIDQQPPQ